MSTFLIVLQLVVVFGGGAALTWLFAALAVDSLPMFKNSKGKK